MALKLGKCRLCLKLGDFYSIFTVDNAVQLSEMAMECARIKIFDGDGLPDKVCGECVQKLSSAYIFKQQCERADAELRRNYIPPPGFSITPPPQNRQSSDSAFSSGNTDLSYQKPPSTEKVTPANRSRKRSHESADDSEYEYHRPMSLTTKRVQALRNSTKRPRNQSPNNSVMDSDGEDNSISHFDTDSDEPLLHSYKCKQCGKSFKSGTSLSNHARTHSKEADKPMAKDTVVNTPRKSLEDATDSEDKLTCDKCNKTFKLKIMLKRHSETCGKSPQKEVSKQLLISLEPIDALAKSPDPNSIVCDMCPTKFKTYDNLQKHMRVCHAAVPKQPRPTTNEVKQKVSVPCLYCKTVFDDFIAFSSHFMNCPKKNDSPLSCTVCEKVMSKRHTYLSHIRQIHFLIANRTETPTNASRTETPTKTFDCRMCQKKLATQDQLISHLASHMSNMQEAEDPDDGGISTDVDVEAADSDYTNSTVSSGSYKCKVCDKVFKYKKACESHENKHKEEKVAKVKAEPPDKPSTSFEQSYLESEEEESPAEGDDLTCDICEKMFSYKRLLIHHKKTKHHMSSGHKRAKINLKDCSVRCLICDVEMKVSSINEHNQKHIVVNVKPRNLYTCAECSEQFKSCSGLANHIKLIHRLKQQPIKNLPEQFEGADLADFCEVVVTKSEPLDDIQSHNGFVEVPVSGAAVDMAGFSCHLCGKTLKTLLSLKRHVNWHANVGEKLEKNLECFVCKEKFRFQCHYRMHMRAHYTDPNVDPALLTCAICGRRSKHLRAAQAHANFHKQTRFSATDYQCSICKRVFQYRKVYLCHMAIHYKRGDGQDAIVGDHPFGGAGGAGGGQPGAGPQLACPQCGKVCDSENSLKCHVRWHTSKSSLYGSRHECTICHLQFTNKRRLEIHIRGHYEDENGPYKCTVCGKGYIDEEYYRRHVKGHNFDHQVHKTRIEKLRRGKVKCPICNRYYPDLVKLIRHLKRTHPESKMIKADPDAPPPQRFDCKLCAKSFLTEHRLRRHEEAHLRKHEFFKCKFCGIKSVSLQKHRLHVKQRHLTSNYFDNPLKCPHCTETFVRGYLLHHHIRDVHDIDEMWLAEGAEEPLGPLKEFQCSVCLKILASKGNFERHIDYHNSLRCNYCFDYFSSLKFLEGHLAFSCDKKKLIGDTETYPKKVKCHLCYKAFHLQVKLDCHLRTQHDILVNREASEGKQEIACDYCFRVFENEYALTQHKLYHRSVGYYGCLYCNKKFNTLVLFHRHKRNHLYRLYPDNPVKCEHCEETFVAFRDMIDHMKEVHGDDKEWVIMPKEITEEKCPICNKIFFNLPRHLNYHEDNRCKKCGEYFYSRIACDNHLCAIESDDEVNEENENDIRPKYEECTFCFKPITRKNTKKLHDNLHSVSGAISCRFCQLKFKTIDAFNIHAFSHRSRKYHKKPIKCRICKEKFVQYGPFIKHMKGVHKSTKKVHYRTKVKPERCVVCGDYFPNLHNHYRSHLLNQCQLCRKYFTSVKVFDQHQCDKEDSDPSKVFTSDEDLMALIKSYVPKDEKDDEKFYGYTDDEEEEEESHNGFDAQNDESQNSQDAENSLLQPFIISDVLSLYERKEELLAMYQKEDPKKREIKTYKAKKRTPKKKEIPKPVDTTTNGNNDDSDVEIVDLLDDESQPEPIITIDLDDD